MSRKSRRSAIPPASRPPVPSAPEGPRLTAVLCARAPVDANAGSLRSLADSEGWSVYPVVFPLPARLTDVRWLSDRRGVDVVIINALGDLKLPKEYTYPALLSWLSSGVKIASVQDGTFVKPETHSDAIRLALNLYSAEIAGAGDASSVSKMGRPGGKP